MSQKIVVGLTPEGRLYKSVQGMKRFGATLWLSKSEY